jgi:hypothetical protein
MIPADMLRNGNSNCAKELAREAVKSHGDRREIVQLEGEPKF